MKVTVREGTHNFKIPIPLFLGSIAIRCIPKDTISKEQKDLAIKVFKALKRDIKKYKGINIVEVKTANGEEVIISI